MPGHDDASALIGAILNQRWRLVRLIGAGGLGLVFEAEGLHGEGRFAIKLLRREFCEDAQIVDRFLAEALVGARIDHPGVAKVHAAERAEDGTPYLLVELLTGHPLTDRMNAGRLPVEQAAPIVHAVLLAVAAAHAMGVVHRDLKPDNIFLARNPSGGVDIKVLDFGLSRVIDAAGGVARKTRTGMLLGTPGYMSPEQIRDVKQADLRADLWSVGIIFYEMLTGRPAFEAENEFARITKVLTEDPVPIEQVAPQYAHWAPFFRRALAREPAERFQSATEMADALMTVAREGHMPVPAHHFDAIPASALPSSRAVPPVGQALFSHDTAISAGAMAPGTELPAEARVEVVTPVVERAQVPAGIAFVIAVVALGLGIFIGFTFAHC